MTYPSQPNPYGGAPDPQQPQPSGAWPTDPNTGQYAQTPQQPYGQQPYPTQPYPYAQPPGFTGPLPSSNFGWAIAALILCWPFCIPSFLAASKVKTAIAMGDMVTANKASEDAKKWGRIGIIVGVILVVISIILTVVAASMVARYY